MAYTTKQSKEEGKDTSTTPDPRHHVWERDKSTRNITHKRAKRSALSQQVITRLQGTDKTA